jgi:hypothetical protein
VVTAAAPARRERVTEQGNRIDVAILRNFLKRALENDAAADQVNELLFEHVVAGRHRLIWSGTSSKARSRARRAFLSDLAAQRYDVAWLEAADYRSVAGLAARYSDLGLGLADYSNRGARGALRNPTPGQFRQPPFSRCDSAPGRIVHAAACGFLAWTAELRRWPD